MIRPGGSFYRMTGCGRRVPEWWGEETTTPPPPGSLVCDNCTNHGGVLRHDRPSL
jgi:hypothetical protein